MAYAAIILFIGLIVGAPAYTVMGWIAGVGVGLWVLIVLGTIAGALVDNDNTPILFCGCFTLFFAIAPIFLYLLIPTTQLLIVSIIIFSLCSLLQTAISKSIQIKD